MNPLIIDVILAAIAAFLMWSGWHQGFIRAAGSLLGLVISIAVSIWGIGWLEDITGLELTSNPVVFVGVFLFLAIFVNQIVRLIVTGLDLVRRLISIIPFVGLANRLLGLALGVVQAVILIGALAYVTVSYMPAGGFRQAMKESVLVGTGIDMGESLGLF